jgi:large subunit ribosomal protein L29
MKNAEIRSLTLDELKRKLVAEKEGLVKLRFAHAISPIENPTKIGESRRLIARIKTVIMEKEKESQK